MPQPRANNRHPGDNFTATPRRFERRIEVAYDVAKLRQFMRDEELEGWRLAAAMSEAGGLSYVLIFEREILT